jgi:hypothetical protein
MKGVVIVQKAHRYEFEHAMPCCSVAYASSKLSRSRTTSGPSRQRRS